MSMSNTKDSFYTLVNYIENELGFATSHYNEDYVKRRIKSRMRRSNVKNYNQYYNLLQKNTLEHEKLLNSFNINVTQFFRNKEVWNAIENILVQLCQVKRGDINIWSAGCADGREPYSLSMISHDNPQIDEERINITATDINNETLQKAIEGRYKKTQTVDIEDELSYLNNSIDYVKQHRNFFTVKRFVKENITFEKHDIIRDPPKENIDLVICRNLFIYIDHDYELKIIDQIANILNKKGILVLGKAESIHKDNKDKFKPLSTHLRIYQLK